MLPNNDLSFQLWSSRASTSLDAQFGVLKALGYTDVQPYHSQYEDVPGLKRLLQAHGLSAKTGHFDVKMFERDFDRVVSAAHRLDMDLVVAPYIQAPERPTDVAGWKRWGVALRTYARRCQQNGLTFAWHNHDFEFVRLPDGSFPIDHLLGDEVAWEIDVAWVVRAGVDPQPWIERYSGRIPAVHVKDIAAGERVTAEGGWADVGYGIVDWNKLWDVAVAAGPQLMIAEHDAPDDYVRFATRSIVTMKRLARVAQ